MEGFDTNNPKLTALLRDKIGEIFILERVILENPVKEIISVTNISVVV